MSISGERMTKFWEKAHKCSHENLSPDYLGCTTCSTPYCSIVETHCLDCGVFISECGCGANNGMSGWSGRMWYSKRRKIDT